MGIEKFLVEKGYDCFIEYSENINFYYLTGVKSLEGSFLLIFRDGEKILITSGFEKENVERICKDVKILTYEDLKYYDILKEEKNRIKAVSICIKKVIESKNAERIVVGNEFPGGILYNLMNLGIKIYPIKNPVIEIRTIKSVDEIKKIEKVSNITISCFKYILKLVKRGERNIDKIRKKASIFLLKRNCICKDLILASGVKSRIPHYRGEGLIEKHLIVDIFPKSLENFYYSDFTRTILVEKHEEIENMLKACIEAQEKAIKMIKDGVKAKDIHLKVVEVLESYGYKTNIEKGEGVIHATGHGVGLEVHEPPIISSLSDDILKKGMVVTVEPGLYYRNIGGVRVEDLILVKRNNCKILTNYKEKLIKVF